jgi:hypothetical protein
MREGAAGQGWQALVLQDVKRALLARPWSRDLFLRGSLARGSADSESDIDLVATVPGAAFEVALADLTGALPHSFPGSLPPWLDALVRDFGGVGFVYLIELGAQKWGQLDIYLLPHARRHRLNEHENEFAVRFSTRDGVEDGDSVVAADVDTMRRLFEEHALRDLQQAVLACYVTMVLWRKRLVRGDRVQAFAETYAAARCVRNLVFLACCPDATGYGWRDVPRAAAKSSNPALVLNAVATFAANDVAEPHELAGRVAALEETVALLAPATWRAHGRSLRSLGRYLALPSAGDASESRSSGFKVFATRKP